MRRGHYEILLDNRGDPSGDDFLAAGDRSDRSLKGVSEEKGLDHDPRHLARRREVAGRCRPEHPQVVVVDRFSSEFPIGGIACRRSLGPMSKLRWTSKSSTKLADELVRQGFEVSSRSVLRLLHKLGYSLQANAKVSEGRQYPDPDAQFNHLNNTADAFIDAGQPVISVDSKKKEMIGNYSKGGADWAPAGEPERTNVHDFVDPELAEYAKATPYGSTTSSTTRAGSASATGSGPGRSNSLRWPKRPASTSPSATIPRGRRSGTKSCTVSSASSPSTGAVVPSPACAPSSS
jgi:hypothetical protein